MDTMIEQATRPFIEVTEVWRPEGDRLVPAGGNYGDLDDFAATSGRTSFAKGEGLPGKAWAEGRPVVLKEFDGSYFLRTEAAKQAGLTTAVAIPIFAGDLLKAVIVVFCSDDDVRTGAIEVWVEDEDYLTLEDGYYGAAKHFEWVSQHTHFPRGQGLPGGVWASDTPILMRDLGAGYRFIRSDSAGKAGLTTGLGLPIPVPGDKTYVVTLLSARGTPIAQRFEIWDARTVKVGNTNAAMMIDGICDREGPLWDPDTPRQIAAWQGAIGLVLGSGLPVAQKGTPGLPAGYTNVVALPLYDGTSIAHIIAWYS
ncbi:MAG: GAF domain-containing protein [Rhodobacteraceae bacterium]|nr:GAF domain-containing protein [Paracoccaceae bacterium]MAY43926.1 GAF domain-containing protein [Paracoccaceae bacterium]